MEKEEDFTKLWRVKKTILELCHDRGYFVTQDELEETLDEFKQLYGSKSRSDEPLRTRMKLLFYHSIDKEKMYIFFANDKTLSKSNVVNICQEMQKDGVHRAIIVVQESLTPVGKRAVAGFAPTFNLEVFMEAELLVNIMDHEFVPKHIVLSSEEKEELFTKFNLSENLLMRLQSNDPVARYYGLRRGQVVKIIRDSETAGRYISYRVVC